MLKSLPLCCVGMVKHDFECIYKLLAEYCRRCCAAVLRDSALLNMLDVGANYKEVLQAWLTTTNMLFRWLAEECTDPEQ